MAVDTKEKKGAIFIATEDGRKQLLGFRVIQDGVLGIAYMKNGNAVGFKPIKEFIDEFFGGVFLILDSAGTVLPNESHTSAKDHVMKQPIL